MLMDAKAIFNYQGAPLSLVAAAAGTIAAPNIYDALGTGVGTPPQVIIGNVSVFGSDLGVGHRKMEIQANIGTAFVSGAGSTLEMVFQIAEDTGAAGGYLPGTWQTVATTGAQTAANLTAGTPLRMEWPVSFPADFSPRFSRLAFVETAAVTAGTIAAAFVTMVRDDYSEKYAASNFSV